MAVPQLLTPQIGIEYLGGLFDGEGSVGITNHINGGLFPQLSLTNTDIRVLELTKKYLNGSIQYNRRGVNYQTYQWIVSNISARKAAEILIPFTIIKRRELELICEYYDKMYPLGIKQRATSRWNKSDAANIQLERNRIHQEYQGYILDARKENRITHTTDRLQTI